MRKELLDELMIISEEEKKYKSGQSTVEQSLYAKDNLTEIDRKRLLQRGKLITVRPHSRFVDFPEHRHNYVEMMYVVQGSITHYIEGKELVLRKGDNSSLDYKETVVQAVMEYINSDCQNANLTKIAEDTHQSMTVLSKLMKQKTGYTFQELLQRKRFQKAVYLLVETELTVEDIALEVGYENQSYFYRQFQKRYGMTPKKYRDLHKKDVHIRI